MKPYNFQLYGQTKLRSSPPIGCRVTFAKLNAFALPPRWLNLKRKPKPNRQRKILRLPRKSMKPNL